MTVERALRVWSVALLAVLLAACGGGAAQVVDGAEGAADDPATTSATVDDAVDGVDEVMRAQLTAPESTTVRAVAASDDRFVAAGADADGPAAWVATADGTWQRQRIRRPGRVAAVEAVALHDGTGLLAGTDGDTSRLWAWDAAEDAWRPAGATGIDGRVAALTHDGRRWLAAGDQVDPEAGETYRGVVWASDDGRTFTPLGEDLDLAEGTVRDIAVDDDGVVVVVGFDVTGGRVWTAAADGSWRSVDRPWGPVALAGVAAADDGFTIVGRGIADLAPFAWSSPDGGDWTEVGVDSRGVEPTDELHDATAVDGVVTVAGGGAEGGVLWTLVDGDLVRR